MLYMQYRTYIICRKERRSSKLGELHPEVVKEVLAQFPEFVGLMKSALTEYKGMLIQL